MISTLLRLTGRSGPFPVGVATRVTTLARDVRSRPSASNVATRSFAHRTTPHRGLDALVVDVVVPPPTVALARVLRVVAVAAARVDADMRGREEVSRAVLYERAFGRRARDVTGADE